MGHSSLAFRMFAFALVWVGLSRPAQAGTDDLSGQLSRVASKDTVEAGRAIEELAERGDPAALPALEALEDGALFVDSVGHLFIGPSNHPKSAVPGIATNPSGPLSTVDLDNTLRRALTPALAALRLSSPDRVVRLSAAADLEKGPSEESAALLRKALSHE